MTQPATHKRPRGFILVVVLLIGAAALAMAVGLSASSGRAGEASIHSAGADQAALFAQSGLDRAEAWALAIGATDTDFDRALDPDLTAGTDAASCDPLGGTITPGAQTGVPRFTDGAIFSDPAFMNGASFRRVAFGDGAYLVRTEDNDDDRNVGFVTTTLDHVGTKGVAPFCVEGPATVAPVPPVALGNNPVRDRDNAIWLTSVGIYPGTNPLTATHRAVMRKLVLDPTATSSSAAALIIGNDLKGNFTGNNSIGGADVVNSIDPGVSLCGPVRFGNTSAATATASCNAANAFLPGPGQPALTVPAPEDKQWYDFATPCNFYMQPNVGLFFWDPDAIRGGVACNTYNGDIVPPNPNASSPPSSGSCWTPIMLKADKIATGDTSVQNALAYEPFERKLSTDFFDEVNRDGHAPCAAFKPKGQPQSADRRYVDPAGGYLASGGGHSPSPSIAGHTFKSWFVGGSPAEQIVTMPDWSGECSPPGRPSEVKWNPPLTGPRVSCGTSCDSTGNTVRFCGEGADDEQFQFLGPASGGVAAAYVTGIYYKQGGYQNIVTFGAVPGAQSDPAWPMITVAVQGGWQMPNNADLPIGVGTALSGYPSAIVRGTMDQGAGSASLGFAGSLFVGNDLTLKKVTTIFGAVQVQNSLIPEGGSNVTWKYDFDLLGGATAATAPPIAPIIAYPVSF